MRFRLATALGVALGLGARAGAQFPVALSLEAEVGASGTVVLGTIESLSRGPAEDHKERLTLTVRVTETLKGAPARSLVLVTVANSPPDGYLDWQKRGVPVLWFADAPPAEGEADPVDRYHQGLTGGPGKRYEPGSPAIVHWAQPLDRAKGIEVVDMEFEVLRSEKAVLDRARRAVREMPGARPVTLIPPWLHPDVFGSDPAHRPTMHWFTTVPRGLPLQGVYLAMPVGPRLERLARRVIERPQSVQPKGDPPKGWASRTKDRSSEAVLLRAAALRALAYFKSPENVALAQRYANDPTTASYRSGSPPQTPVREAARWLLAGWGVALPAAVPEG